MSGGSVTDGVVVVMVKVEYVLAIVGSDNDSVRTWMEYCVALVKPVNVIRTLLLVEASKVSLTMEYTWLLGVLFLQVMFKWT